MDKHVFGLDIELQRMENYSAVKHIHTRINMYAQS